MKKLILASNNQKKIKEMKEILKSMPVEVKSLKDENINIEVEEDGMTFEENARKKAQEIYRFLFERGEQDFIVLADDSGLMVDYLNGEPGIYSARYAGDHGNDEKNNQKLLYKLEGVPVEDRNAKFICQLAIIDSKGKYHKITGEAKGHILKELNGEGGFGYDPIFFYGPLNKTFAQLTSDEKNKISHRGMAMKQFKEIIEDLIK